MNDLVDKLFNTGNLSDEELKTLLESDSFNEPLAHAADIRRRENYGDKVYIRGLIEFTNYCRNNCYYCGIRRDNKKAERYRLTKEEILLCCDEGYRLGFRTFVMQRGSVLYGRNDLRYYLRDKAPLSRLCSHAFNRRKIEKKLSGIFRCRRRQISASP